MERATRLLLDIVGGEAGPVTECAEAAALPERNSIRFREARLTRVLGMAIDTEEVDAMLGRLGFPVTDREDTAEGRIWSVQAPSFRFDIEREADLIEEVARIHGYDRIDVRMPAARLHLVPTDERRLDADAVRDALVGWGGQEILSYSFVDARLAEQLAPGAEALRLANPLSADLAVMRPSLWPGLMKTWMTNRNRQQTRARLFEIGRVFAARGTAAPEETTRIGALLAGSRDPEGWNHDGAEVDFFDARGLVEQLIALTRDVASFRIEPAAHPVLHPGRSARVLRRAADGTEREAGFLGALHPALQEALDLPRPVYLVDLDLDVLSARGTPAHRGLSRYPSVRRDIAVELATEVSAEQVLATVRSAGGELVTDVRLFDVYQGERLPEGRRSLALGVVMQHPERTLEDAETLATTDRIVEALVAELGAVRR
jgi:phenylalanyl-tRNA synthetase beta chain